MSKVITSTIKRWAGTVTLADPLTEAQAIEIERAQSTIEELKANTENLKNIDKLRETTIATNKLKAVKLCVEKWDLQNFTPDPFPFSPRGDSHKLIDWLFDELDKVYQGDSIVPNES